MLNKSLFKFFYLIAVLAIVSSCSRGKNPGVSSNTNWDINDEENGGFTANIEYEKQKAGPGLVFIEGGTFTMGKVQDDIMGDWNNAPTQQHVRSFFMDETEVTNINYREYLYWLKRVFVDPYRNSRTGNRYYYEIYKSALPDTLVWRNKLGATESFVNNYLRHPAYNFYPVVGVSWIQANKYADWRTDRVNEQILVDHGILRQVNGVYQNGNYIVRGENHFETETYLNNPNKVFEGENIDEIYNKGLADLAPNRNQDPENNNGFKGRHTNREDGILLPKYRLPTEAEWEYAALALVGNREFNTIKGGKKFPWNGNSARSKNKKSKGNLLANFKPYSGDYMGIAGWSSDGADITNKVGSYPANDYGLYDMAGNVAEWVADVYRPTIDMEANDFSYFRGNVYKHDSLNVNGEIVYIDSTNFDISRTINGRVKYDDLPGSVYKTTIKPTDASTRSNYLTANNIDYGDGDDASRIDFSTSKKEAMYNSPNYTLNAQGRPIADKTQGRTTLISNDVRIYKGGSWKDRVYWLDPAQRRFLHQDLATDYIGFRCAMDKLGSDEITRTPYFKK